MWWCHNCKGVLKRRPNSDSATAAAPSPHSAAVSPPTSVAMPDRAAAMRNRPVPLPDRAAMMPATQSPPRTNLMFDALLTVSLSRLQSLEAPALSACVKVS